MSINKDLYDAIESNFKINNKNWFINKMEFAKEVYNTYDVEYDFSNVIDIIKNIDIVNESNETKYDKDTNILSIDSSNNKYDLAKSFLQITSQNGLVRIDENGNKDWEYLNDMIIDRLILNTTGLSKKENEDELYKIDEKRCKEDEIMYEMTKVIPQKN